MSKVCTALTKSGISCTRGTDGLYCWQHERVNNSPKVKALRSNSPKNSIMRQSLKPNKTANFMKPIDGVIIVLSAHYVTVDDQDCDLKPYKFPVRELETAENIIKRTLEPMEIITIETSTGVARVLIDSVILTEGQYAHLLKLFKKAGDGIAPDHIVDNRMKFFNVNSNTQMWLDLEGVEVYKNGEVTVYKGDNF